ncbi:MAG: hypothetical protein ABI557_09690, partial [Aureliella sp.]
ELIVLLEGKEIRTGDLFEVRGDRAIFVSRRSETINVGGRKVSPTAVESRLASFPGVALLRAYGRRSPLRPTHSGHAQAVASHQAIKYQIEWVGWHGQYCVNKQRKGLIVF